ncbi:MAG: hypothetical protein KF821_06520 [Anaerolineales bacterium]|nr:hypothetical protein [Anaerolineales bacterium]
MANALDLFVVPLHRRNGQDQAYLQGLHLLAAPRRAARGRNDERLVLQLSLPPEITLSADQQHALLSDLAEGYFRTAGSVTAALREQFERLNSYFLQLNQRLSGATPQAARLAALSMREERVTLAHAGPQHAFRLNQTIQHFYDAPAAGRGLGLSSQTEIRFFQTELAAADCFLLVSEIPGGWNEKTLMGASGQKLSTLRRRFLSEAGQELRAVMLLAQPGSGRLSLMTSFEDSAAAAPPAAPSATRREPAEAASPSWQVLTPAPAEPGHAPAELEDTAAWHPASTASDSLLPGPPEESTGPAQAEWPPRYETQAEPSAILTLWHEISGRATHFWRKASPPLRSFFMRLLPDEPVFNLPRQTLTLIAVAVPLAVVILVSVVYLQFGRGQLYQNYLSQAQSAAALAAARQDPGEVRQAWLAAVHFAQRASAYEQDAEAAQQLLAEAQLQLDGLDLIERMDFQPALFTNLPRNTKITRMVADNTDLYMLDETTGKILHAFLTGGGYKLDESFSCEPAPYGGAIVSQLIDLALLPPRSHPLGASVAAIDANGNIIYCIKNEAPAASALGEPDSRWGKPNAIAVEEDTLYVLDPVTNAVWMYAAENGSFVGAPRFFFGAQVPSMQHMLDIALDGSTLYLLDQDGHVAQCVFNEEGEDSTPCTDPLEFVDTRPGQRNGSVVSGANFSQFVITDPPGPSIFFLDPIVPAVYQFSPRLSIVRQLRAANELPAELVSAFTITPNRAIFLAFENEVYIGFMP